MITTILLDVDDTILDFSLSAEKAMAAALAEKGMVYREEMLPVFLRMNDELWHCLERGELTREGLFAVRWNRIFAVLGIPLDGVAFEARFGHYLAHSAVPVAGAAETLSALAGRFRICAASNAAQEQQERRLSLSGLLPYFECVFTSERIGAQKPDPRFFRACLAALGDPSPDTVLAVGDSLRSDVAGAASCGIRTCWFDRTGRGTDGVSPMPDERVTTLPDLLRLPCLYTGKIRRGNPF